MNDAGGTPDLEGVTVLVTGASRGLGRALALAYGVAGANLALCARSGDSLEALADELAGMDVDAEWEAADVTRPGSLEPLVRRAESRLGGVNVLVNNASVLGSRSRLVDQDPGEWRRVMDVNVTGALLATQAVLPGMRSRGGGSIINVSSGVGDRARAEWGAYAVSKWALEALTWNLALEEKDTGIRANVVDPGAMRTAMRRSAYPSEDPATLPDPIEVAPVFLWLASDASNEVSGERFRAQEWRG